MTRLFDLPLQDLNQSISTYAGSEFGPSLYPDVFSISTPLQLPTVEAMSYDSQMSYGEYVQEPSLDSSPEWDHHDGAQDHGEMDQGPSMSPSWPSILEEMAMQTSLEVEHQQFLETPTGAGSFPGAQAEAAASYTQARDYVVRGTRSGVHKDSTKVWHHPE